MRLIFKAAALAASAVLLVGTSASAEPVVKQVGKDAAANFYSVCDVLTAAEYPVCADETWGDGVTGKVNVIQPREGAPFNLGFSFSGLEPLATYTLHLYDGAYVGVLTTITADEFGYAKYSMQTVDPDGWAFDLNTAGQATVITTWWGPGYTGNHSPIDVAS